MKGGRPMGRARTLSLLNELVEQAEALAARAGEPCLVCAGPTTQLDRCNCDAFLCAACCEREPPEGRGRHEPRDHFAAQA